MKKLIYFILPFILLTTSCKDPNDDEDKFSTSDLNEWLLDGMQQVYLWEDHIPSNLNPLKETDPIAFFDKMLYKAEDEWSWITEDYPSLVARLQGIPTSMGISPAPGLVGNYNVVILVEFVYPNSPAADAGLKRGDIIIKINGTQLNIENYYSLYSLDSYTAELGTVNPSLEIVPSGNTVSLTSRVIETNPIIYHEIKNIEGVKTGYIVYSEFIAGINNKFNNALGDLFDDFKAEGVSEIIFDLRYNPGGEINTAAYIASLLAPVSVVNSNEILVSYLYNSGFQEYFSTGEGADLERLMIKFPANSHNLNLDRVLFLTSRGSASASELVIIGLEPYMEVIQIGDTTHGKYTGAWVIPDTEEPSRHNYAFIPIVLKYVNTSGFTDFKDGLIPDYEAEENFRDLKEFGDLSDPLLAKAVEILGGPAAVQKKSSSTVNVRRIENKFTLQKKNIFFPFERELLHLKPELLPDL